MPKPEDIFKKWNDCSLTGRWKTHRRLTPDIRDAIKYNTGKGWTVEGMCDAIANFAKIVQGKEYKWTYDRWSLAQFLTRGRKDNDLRWVWFHPNNFRDSDWLTKEAVAKQIKQRKQRQVQQSETPQEKESRRLYFERYGRR